MNNKALVSIIVPTKNSESTIGICLKSIKNQSYKNIEIIVVDNNSKDDTKRIALRYTKLVFNRGPERSAQRNFGALESKGKYLLFIDSDMELSSRVVEDCVSKLKIKNIKQKIGGIIIPEKSFGKGFWAKCKALERSFYIGIDWIESARFFPRDTFNEFKGYDEKQTGTEDFDLPQRIKEKHGENSILRITSFIYHNEGKLSLFYTLKKKYYYAKTVKTYAKITTNTVYFKKQANPLNRYKLYFSDPVKLFKNSALGVGMLFMKTSEFIAGGIGYISGGKKKWFSTKLIKNRYPIILLLIVYILFSLLTYKGFGITWDEPSVYNRGENLFYYFTGNNKLQLNFLNDHQESALDSLGVYYNNIYPMVLSQLNPAKTFERYHLLNMLFASLIFLTSYELLLLKYNKYLSLLGPIFIILIPRFFGDIPANPKDIPFAILYFIAIAMIIFTKNIKKDLVKALILGIIFGLTQSLRIVGLSLYLIFLLFNLYEYVCSTRIKIKDLLIFIKNQLIQVIYIFIVATFIMTITYPYVGSNFFLNFANIINMGEKYEWVGTVLFQGKYILSTQLQWTYLATYILITTPLFLLLLLIMSPFVIKNGIKNNIYVILLIAFVINLAIYFFVHPVIYDGIRQYLFLLPIISTIGAISLINIISLVNIKTKLFLLIIISSILLTIINMIKLYPYEYIYFNEFAGGLNGAYQKYETDYWGASYKEAVKWFIVNEVKNKETIYKINTCANPIQSSYYFTSNMKWVSYSEADFFICFTRRDEYKIAENKQLLHTIEREGVPLIFIYKIK